MKNPLLIALLCALGINSHAQTTENGVNEHSKDSKSKSEEINKKDLDNFIGKIVGTQTEVPKASFVVDITNSPEVKFNIPLNKELYNQFYIDGKVGSSNNFTPIIKNGEWLPDVGVSLNYTWFIKTLTKYYTEDINTKYGGDINNANISDASQLCWSWLNFKVGYNYSTLETYNGDLTLLNSAKFEKEYINSLLIKTDLNFFWLPSKGYLPFLTFNGKLGYERKTGDNNYSSLKSLNVRELETITDLNGNVIEVSSDTKRVKHGELVINTTSNFNYNIMALISPNENFYIGFSTYGKYIPIKDLKSLDVGFGITVPIMSMKNDNETLASFTLKYEIPDVRNDLSSVAIREKSIFGFSIGLPINTFRNIRN